MPNLKKKQGGYAKQGGFSLVEVMLVMAMLGVIMMAVVSLYIPAVRSTAVQTEASDVQANLLLAMNRITSDLVLAGYLVRPGYTTGGTAGPIYWQGDVSPNDTDDLTIRTRSVGNAFARIVANDDITGKLGVSDIDMLSAFPVGSSIRIFEGMTTVEAESAGVAAYDEDTASFFDDYVHTVTVNDPTSSTIDGVVCPGSLTVSPVPTVNNLKESVVVKIKDNTQPPMQTIRYRVNGGALERIVNGTTQILARNVDSVVFAYQNSPTGAVKRVDITLTGQAGGLGGGGAESTVKERQLRSSVALRNVY